MKQLTLLFPVVLFLLFACTKKPEAPGPVIYKFNPDKGAFNNTVFIYGVHFDSLLASTSVSFNGVAANVLFVNDTLIRAVVPLNATTGKISVSINGKIATSENDFIILPGKWVRKADMSKYGDGGCIGFSVGNKGYVGGGANGHKDFWEYDPVLDKWSQKADMSFYLAEGISMVINNKAYVGIGRDIAASVPYIHELWEYDPATNIWTRKSDFPGGDRQGAIGLSVNGKGYVGLGKSPATLVGVHDWWEYDPATDTWTRKADNPTPITPGNVLEASSGFAINNKIYVGTGVYSHARHWWEYNPAANAWTKKADYPGNLLFQGSGFVLNNKGYIAGGGSECWQYNATTDSWKQMAFFCQPELWSSVYDRQPRLFFNRL